MKNLFVLSIATIALAACTQELATDQESELRDVGSLEVALTGMDSDLQEYRLRAATFDIYGTRYIDNQTVSRSAFSDDDIESPVLRTRLFHGSYSVTLRPDAWYLERVTPDGTEPVQQAVLLST